jgi:hypothetical protein
MVVHSNHGTICSCVGPNSPKVLCVQGIVGCVVGSCIDPYIPLCLSSQLILISSLVGEGYPHLLNSSPFKGAILGKLSESYNTISLSSISIYLSNTIDGCSLKSWHYLFLYPFVFV